MAIYLDSAKISDAKQVENLGWVYGITTNPKNLAQAEFPPETALRKLSELGKAEVYYQLRSPTVEGALAEAKKAASIVGPSLVLKIPPTPVGFAAAYQLTKHYPCCVTAIYTPSQAIVAAECGAKYVAVYVNRATKAMGDGISIVRDVAAVLKGKKTEILAASLKSPEEAASAVLAGASHITLQLSVLLSLIDHQASTLACEEFDSIGAGIEVG